MEWEDGSDGKQKSEQKGIRQFIKEGEQTRRKIETPLLKRSYN